MLRKNKGADNENEEFVYMLLYYIGCTFIVAWSFNVKYMIDIKVLNNKIKSLSNPTCDTAILQPNKYKSIEVKLKDTAENDYSFYSGIIPEKFVKECDADHSYFYMYSIEKIYTDDIKEVSIGDYK